MKEWTTDMQKSLDESPGNPTEWKKLIQKVIYCIVLFVKYSCKNKNIEIDKNTEMVVRGQEQKV